MKITFLGTGTSHGVPSIDCMRQQYQRCPHQVCLKAEHDPRYRRMRSSILLELQQYEVLIDTSQDFREQMLRAHVTRLDAVLYTHGHADHIFGLPDTRSYTHRDEPPLPVYASPETMHTLRSSFGYVFDPPTFVGGGIPILAPHVVSTRFTLAGHDIYPIHVEHGPLQGCLGYRIDNTAYIPDVHTIPAAALDMLQGLDLLIINCLRERPHSSHLSLSESLHYAELLAPQLALFTHMTHDIDYALEEPNLPTNVHFAYDGLQLTV
ncbi:MAG: MBL fold metallo-hydrolase [Chloroflexi bacterium]|nr:MBL fold metallo-hydrolase [Chloroflexota bacterium]